MKWYFSNKEGGFYPEDTLEYCKSVNALPDDLKEVTAEEHEEFTGLNPLNKVPFYATKAKKMMWVDAPAITYTKAQLIEQAELQKTALMNTANKNIAPLQDAADLGIATDDEAAQLLAWKQYRVMLNRVDTSLAPDIECPDKPTFR